MMKKKTIWFINKDAAPIEFYGTHLRTIKLAQYFQSEGYNVKLFCSSYVHNRNLCLSDSNKTFEEKTYDNIPFVLVNAGCGSTNGDTGVLLIVIRIVFLLIFQFINLLKR